MLFDDTLPKKVGMKICPNCKSQNHNSRRFCQECPHEFQILSSINKTRKKSYKYCTQCGAQNEVGVRFCRTCKEEFYAKRKRKSVIRSEAKEIKLIEWQSAQFRKMEESQLDGISRQITYKIFPTPTEELPGSPQKIQILRNRLQNGEELWHPEDR